MKNLELLRRIVPSGGALVFLLVACDSTESSSVAMGGSNDGPVTGMGGSPASPTMPQPGSALGGGSGVPAMPQPGSAIGGGAGSPAMPQPEPPNGPGGAGPTPEQPGSAAGGDSGAGGEPSPPRTYRVASITTSTGEMLFWLDDQTPMHKAKFIELAGEEHYNQFTFNRVVSDFVIQGGCPDDPTYFEDSPYLLDPEFVDSLVHKYGALGMGRDDNPEKQSNACQFYVVNAPNGTAFLDGDYTVFGEIIHGSDVLDAISAVETDASDKPLTDLPLDVQIKEFSAAQLEAEYGFTVPE